MAGEYPFINAPGSGWHDTSPNSGTVARQIRSQTKAQLLQEAASLVPDASKLSEELIKHKISGGDKAFFVGRLNQMLNDYLQEYNSNPFFAFSKKGKDLAKEMQRHVNHPILTQLEVENEHNEALRKRAIEKGIDSQVNVVNGKISVLNHKTGEFYDKESDVIDANDEVLTPESITSQFGKRGFYNVKNPYQPAKAPQVTMASRKEVQEFINSVMEGMGSTTTESLTSELEGVLGRRTKMNADQLEKKMLSILSPAGMPSNYWDTLLSTVYTDFLSKGYKLPSKKQAVEIATQSLIDQINGRGVFEGEYTSRPMEIAKTQSTLAKEKKEQTASVGALESFFTDNSVGDPAQITGLSKDGDRWSLPGKAISSSIVFEQAAGERGKLPYLSNPLYKILADKEVKTLFGEVPVNKALTLPATDGQFKIVKDKDGKQWMVFDIFAAKSAFGDAKVGAKEEAKDLTDAEKVHLEGIFSTMEKRKEDGALGYDYEDNSYYGYENYVRVPVKVAFDPYKTSQLRIVDRQDFYIDRAAETLGKAPAPGTGSTGTTRNRFQP